MDAQISVYTHVGEPEAVCVCVCLRACMRVHAYMRAAAAFHVCVPLVYIIVPFV